MKILNTNIDIKSMFKNLKLAYYLHYIILEKFLNGVKLNFNMENGVYRIYNKKIFLGLGVINNNILKRDVIIIDNF